jgi:hypothetical protein
MLASLAEEQAGGRAEQSGTAFGWIGERGEAKSGSAFGGVGERGKASVSARNASKAWGRLFISAKTRGPHAALSGSAGKGKGRRLGIDGVAER